MFKVSSGLSPPLISDILKHKIFILTICDKIFSFPDLFLKLCFMEARADII